VRGGAPPRTPHDVLPLSPNSQRKFDQRERRVKREQKMTNEARDADVAASQRMTPRGTPVQSATATTSGIAPIAVEGGSGGGAAVQTSGYLSQEKGKQRRCRLAKDVLRKISAASTSGVAPSTAESGSSEGGTTAQQRTPSGSGYLSLEEGEQRRCRLAKDVLRNISRVDTFARYLSQLGGVAPPTSSTGVCLIELGSPQPTSPRERVKGGKADISAAAWDLHAPSGGTSGEDSRQQQRAGGGAAGGASDGEGSENGRATSTAEVLLSSRQCPQPRVEAMARDMVSAHLATAPLPRGEKGGVVPAISPRILAAAAAAESKMHINALLREHVERSASSDEDKSKLKKKKVMEFGNGRIPPLPSPNSRSVRSTGSSVSAMSMLYVVVITFSFPLVTILFSLFSLRTLLM